MDDYDQMTFNERDEVDAEEARRLAVVQGYSDRPGTIRRAFAVDSSGYSLDAVA